MAGQDFSLDRRRLLVSAAALPVASVVPGVKPANAVAPDVFQSSPLTLEAEPANFCAGTARRLAEIARRNRLRYDFGLPLLSVATELRRMKTAAETERVERFRNTLREPVFQKMLTRARRQRGDAAWEPKGFCERWQFSNEVEMRLKRLYDELAEGRRQQQSPPHWGDAPCHASRAP